MEVHPLLGFSADARRVTSSAGFSAGALGWAGRLPPAAPVYHLTVPANTIMPAGGIASYLPLTRNRELGGALGRLFLRVEMGARGVQPASVRLTVVSEPVPAGARGGDAARSMPRGFEWRRTAACQLSPQQPQQATGSGLGAAAVFVCELSALGGGDDAAVVVVREGLGRAA